MGRPLFCVSRSRTIAERRSAVLLPMGGWISQVRSGSYDAVKVVGFLRVLLRNISGKLLLIWDGSPIHRGQPVKDFLRRGAARRLHLEQLPGYAPDLNPDEGVWNYLKRVELANVCCSDLQELRRQLIRARERVRHKHDILRACSRACGYAVSFFLTRSGNAARFGNPAPGLGAKRSCHSRMSVLDAWVEAANPASASA